VSFAASDQAKEQIRQAVDIVDLVGGYLELRRQGRIYVAHCPWHDDRRPSLQVNPERQSWKCWVCGIGGDVFSFVMQREGVEFREALVMLAERAGVVLPTARPAPPASPGSPEDKRTLYQAMAWAERQYHECFLRSPEAEGARRYIAGRGISQASVERFRIGFSPEGWQWILDRARATEFSPQVLEAVGLVARSNDGNRPYDRFRGRVLFPIRDTQGRPIALGGRILPEASGRNENVAKYINSPETRLFSKSEQLYGLDLVRDVLTRTRHVAVMEGYTDVVVAQQHGVANVVAVLGTALGPRHVQLLRRFADTITLVLDGDEAGQRRTNEILELFVAQQVDLRVLTLPEGLDPCDFVLAHGGEAFNGLLSQAVDALEHKVRVATSGLEPARDVHRSHQALEDVLATMARAPRLTSAAAASARLREQQLLSRLARQFQINETDIRGRLAELRRGKRQSAGGTEEADSARSVSAAQLEACERELLEILTQHPEAALSAAESIAPHELASEPAQRIFAEFARLAAAGSADFNRVLAALEEPSLASLLVDLDDSARGKGADDAELRLRELFQTFRRRRDERAGREQLAALENRSLNEKEELELLNQLIEQKRDRQGISAPMDG
jgi:DNA primase